MEKEWQTNAGPGVERKEPSERRALEAGCTGPQPRNRPATLSYPIFPELVTLCLSRRILWPPKPKVQAGPGSNLPASAESV